MKYYMLEVEDWTQPTHNNKRRVSGKKALSDNETKEAFQATSKLSPSALPPAPPEAEVEDTFEVTHPPNSHLFPTRARANSSPNARPSSSLSRLLAQASPAPEVPADNNTTATDNNNVPADNNASDTTPEIHSPSSPPTSPPPPPSPSLPVDSAPPNATLNNIIPVVSASSPLRPGSRASRLSTTSRFSVGRIPTLAPQTKAAPTTALSEQALAVSPSSTDNNPFMSPTTPSPEEAISNAVTNVVNQRRLRTTSYQAPRSPLSVTSSQATVVPIRPSMATTATLANLASSWGMSFGRKKKVEGGTNLAPTVEASIDGSGGERQPGDSSSNSSSARDLLKKF